MSKADEARDILEQLGLPQAQQNEISCLTLLALTGLSESDPWSHSSRPSRTIHEILVFMRDVYGKDYAENTRETVRRRVIHQLSRRVSWTVTRTLQDLATNSPRTHYGLTDEALESRPTLPDQRLGVRAAGLPLRTRRPVGNIPATEADAGNTHPHPDGRTVSPVPGDAQPIAGGCSECLRTQVRARAVLLYLGDAAKKLLHLEDEKLAQLGVPITEHDKLPDVVLYDEERNWLFLVEAVTSHGPVTPKRFEELEATLEDCMAARVYVSAFPDFRQFKRHADDIAWETEVWLSEIPDHLIHFNGDKFLGPRGSNS